MRSTALLVVLLVLLVGVSGIRFTSDTPVALWSPEGYLDGKHALGSVGIPDVHNWLMSLLNRENSPYVSLKGEKPEVVIVFAEAKIRSDHLSIYKASFSHLKEYISSSESSIYSPFLDLEFSFDSSLISFAERVPGDVVFGGKSSVILPQLRQNVPKARIVTSIGKLQESLPITLFNNGVTDLIIVYLDSQKPTLPAKYAESDEAIHQLIEYVSAYTSKYVAVYLGLEYDAPHYATKFVAPISVHAKRAFWALLQNNTNSNTTNGTIPIFRQYFGGWFWELFLVAIFLIPLLLVGVCAIDGIQTPIFDTKAKKAAHVVGGSNK